MTLEINIRREVKNVWEKRTPLTPEAAAALKSQGIQLSVQTSPNRIFPDQHYQEIGLPLTADSSNAQVVVGIKEPQLIEIQQGQVHLAFSHTIKGQKYNMPLLQKFLDEGASLIDYELLTDETGKRTLAFGRYAGIAGAIDSLWLLGLKYALRGQISGLTEVKQTYHYGSIAQAKPAIEKAASLGHALRIIITGAGNVSQGCKEVCQWLGLPEVSPAQVLAGTTGKESWFSMVDIQDMNETISGEPFSLQEYFAEGKIKYKNFFHRYLGEFDLLLQGAYWDDRYPKQMPAQVFIDQAKKLPPVIGDVSCDIDGSLACTVKATSIDAPVFTYVNGQAVDGISWDGPSVLAVDNLPCELSIDASQHFSNTLQTLLPEVARMDLNQPLEQSGLSPMLQRAMIVYRGELTEKYSYLKKYLEQQ